jgi:hypothetical protein
MAKQRAIVKRPETGEATRVQKAAAASAFSIFGGGGVDPGTFETYRKMRGNPTIALARAVANAPIQTSEYRLEAEEGIPDAIMGWMDEQVKYLWGGFLSDAIRARDYGFQAWEKVYDIYEGKLWINKLKALLPDNTQPVLDKDTGAFLGLKQTGVILPPEKCLWYAYDAEAGDYYGRSQHENIRATAWRSWERLAEKELQYICKIAGILPIIHYPIGQSKNARGQLVSNHTIAETVLSSLGSGHGVAVPQELADWVTDLARSGIDPDKIMAWRISFLEETSSHGDSFVNEMRHKESLMMRGWLVPERAATEGQSGTKAEAETHGQVAMVTANLVLMDMMRCFNWYVVNPLLVMNFGPQYEGTIWLERAGTDPVMVAFYRDMLSKVLGDPNNVDLFQTWLDVKGMMQAAGLPGDGPPDDSLPKDSVLKQAASMLPQLDKTLAGLLC